MERASGGLCGAGERDEQRRQQPGPTCGTDPIDIAHAFLRVLPSTAPCVLPDRCWVGVWFRVYRLSHCNIAEWTTHNITYCFEYLRHVRTGSTFAWRERRAKIHGRLEYGLESSEDCRSAGGHGNQHVRLRGAKISRIRTICPAREGLAFEPWQAPWLSCHPLTSRRFCSRRASAGGFRRLVSKNQAQLRFGIIGEIRYCRLALG